MTTLIREVLIYSQLADKKETFETVSLHAVIANVLNDYELLIEQKKAVVTSDHVPDIEAIPTQMTQLFSNLVSNALKFARTDIKPVITITVRNATSEEISENPLPHKTYFTIQITDNGIGIRTEY